MVAGADVPTAAMDVQQAEAARADAHTDAKAVACAGKAAEQLKELEGKKLKSNFKEERETDDEDEKKMLEELKSAPDCFPRHDERQEELKEKFEFEEEKESEEEKRGMLNRFDKNQTSEKDEREEKRKEETGTRPHECG